MISKAKLLKHFLKLDIVHYSACYYS